MNSLEILGPALALLIALGGAERAALAPRSAPRPDPYPRQRDARQVDHYEIDTRRAGRRRPCLLRQNDRDGGEIHFPRWNRKDGRQKGFGQYKGTNHRFSTSQAPRR